MKYFIDCEFIDDGHTIDLISIGIVAGDGRELYMQSCEFNPDKASAWVQKHVFSSLVVCPRLSGNVRGLYAHESGQCPSTPECPWRTRPQMRQDISDFIDTSRPVALYGWCAGYDFVALCQLFGPMMSLPRGFPHYIRDLQRDLDERGIADRDLPRQERGVHNALEDARYIKWLWEYLHGQPDTLV